MTFTPSFLVLDVSERFVLTFFIVIPAGLIISSAENPVKGLINTVSVSVSFGAGLISSLLSGSVFGLPLVPQATSTRIHITAAMADTNLVAFLNFIAFTILSFTFLSPNARGLAKANLLPVEKDSNAVL